MADDNSKLSLHTYHDSSPTWRVRVVLALKGIDYERVYFSFDAPPDEKYLKLNPLGQIPCLVINDNIVITQSMAIVSYLDQKYPSPALLPTDLIKKAKAVEIAEIVNSAMQPLHNYFSMVYMENEPEYFRHSKPYVEKGLEAVEKILEKTSGKYCVGDEVSLADVFLLPEVYRAIEYGVDLASFPNVEKMWKELMKIEAFNCCHPDNEPDCPKNSK